MTILHVTLVIHDGMFDCQVPVADILCCKPSELAFYPVPKLMIRRVGDHEAHSATRAVRLIDKCSSTLILRRAVEQAILRVGRGCEAHHEAAT